MGQLVTSVGATFIAHITHARQAPYQCRAQTKTMQQKPTTTAQRQTGAERSRPSTEPLTRARRVCRRLRASPTGPGVREACRDKPCSASEHARASAGATHELRDGDEADADEREEAAAVPARSGGGRRSHPSRGCSVKHALACPLTPARTHACCGRRRASLLTYVLFESRLRQRPLQMANMGEKERKIESKQDGERETNRE